MQLSKKFLGCLALTGFAFSTPAIAQLPSVAIAAAWSTQCNIDDVQMKLIATGRFSAVDVIDVKTVTPMLSTLTLYDSVLTWTNLSYADGAALGDVFADYVDQGGGVVVGVFATSTATPNRSLTGRWDTGGYSIIQTMGGNQLGPAALGMVLQPTSPLMAGVTTVSATQAFRPQSTTLVQGAVVAEWDDGKILVAAGTMPGRVDLGLFPPSSDCTASNWDITTNGGTLIANALAEVSGAMSFPGFCDPANNNSTGFPCQLFGNFGTGVGSDLHLDATQGPPGEFGYFLMGTTFIDPGLTISQGELCVSGMIGRYNIAGTQFNSIGRFDAAGDLENFVGTSSSGYGYDIPVSVPISGTPVITSGSTWHFQLWYREAGGNANFSNGMSVTFP